MCRGRVVEQGDMDAVIASPAHPCTQQLSDSAPSPDPEARWTERPDLRTAVETREMRVGTKCICAERCPKVTAPCRAERPAFMRAEASQQAARFCMATGRPTRLEPTRRSRTGRAAGDAG